MYIEIEKDKDKRFLKVIWQRVFDMLHNRNIYGSKQYT